MTTSKIRSIAIVLLFPITCLGQADWKRIDLDGNLSFYFPKEYQKTDTLGQTLFQASTSLARLQVVKIPQPHAKIENSNELIAFYNAFQNVTIEQSQGKLTFDSTLRLNDLYYRVFEFKNHSGDQLILNESKIVFIDRTLYSISFACARNQMPKTAEERNKFLSLIIRETDFEDQLTVKSKAEQLGDSIGHIIKYVMLAGFVVAIALWFLKKYEQVRIINAIFSWIFILFGAMCCVLYLGNLAYGNNVGLLGLTGFIWLVIGLMLRRDKIPKYKA